ncbi:hypothetical protein ACFSTC_33210 [Nonomuraea ferruginea]
MLLRLRVSLADRPGGLGQVAKVLGTLGADILQVTVLEREMGRAVDDFVVSWPGPAGADEVRERFSAVPGVRVEGVWPTREVPGSAPDYDLLMHVAAEPSRGLATLVDALPGLCGAEWSVAYAGGSVVHSSIAAPELARPARAAAARRHAGRREGAAHAAAHDRVPAAPARGPGRRARVPPRRAGTGRAHRGRRLRPGRPRLTARTPAGPSTRSGRPSGTVHPPLTRIRKSDGPPPPTTPPFRPPTAEADPVVRPGWEDCGFREKISGLLLIAEHFSYGYG